MVTPKQLLNYFKSNGTIVLILFAAAVLRLWFPTKIPFTHDEFSALFRTEFENFNDLIQFGVKPDGHPALIQAFLFYWVRIFGCKELLIKLPFIFAGISSVYILYIIAIKWFNQTVALISAAFMASLQYPVMYSQIARPYISGLFFSLMMVWFWTRLILIPKSQFWKNGMFYVLFSVLCAYNHYFSLLFVLVVGITGLFGIERKYVLKYICLGLIVFILYVPHLGIFFHQLKTGSVEEWLGKPELTFLTDYIQYIFQFSVFVGLLVFVIMFFGILPNIDKLKWNKRFFKISIIWFLTPVLVGFIYSYAIGAVLQFSVLIFSFPYLLFLLFSHIPNLRKEYNILIVLLILTINIVSLIFERQHYKLFYQSVYEQIIIETQNTQKVYGNRCISIISSSKKISEFYMERNGLQPDFIWLEAYQSPLDFISFLKRQKCEYLSFGCLSQIEPNIISMITEIYPDLINEKDYIGGNFYIFSKRKSIYSRYYSGKVLNDFESNIENWELLKPENRDTTIFYSGKYSYLMTEKEEYSPTYSGNLYSFLSSKNDFIDISVMIYSNRKMNNIFIASSIEDNGKILDSRVSNINDFIMEDSAPKWHRAYHSIKLSDIRLKNSTPKLKVFIWNKGKENFYIENFEIIGRKGNDLIYGLQEKLLN